MAIFMDTVFVALHQGNWAEVITPKGHQLFVYRGDLNDVGYATIPEDGEENYSSGFLIGCGRVLSPTSETT